MPDNSQKNKQQQPQRSNQLVPQNAPKNAVRRVESNPLLMSPEHWARLKEISESAVKSGLLPKSVDNAQKAFVIALKGNELGFSPMYALERIAVINGKATIDGQAMLRLIYERVPGCKVAFYTPVEKAATECEVGITRPGQTELRVRFTMDDAKRAGLLEKPGPWKTYPRAMLRWRAISEAARITVPDAIAGLYLHEELGANVNDAGEIIDADFKVLEKDGSSQSPSPNVAGADSHVVETPAPASPPVDEPFDPNKPTKSQLKRLHAIKGESNWTDDDLKALLKNSFGLESTKDLNLDQYEFICGHMQENVKTDEAPTA